MAGKHHNRISWFGKAALFLVLLLVPLGIGVLGILWGFLDDYQHSLPENVAQEGLALFETGDLDVLSRYIEYVPNPMEAENSFQEIVKQYFTPKADGAGEYTLIPQVGGGTERRYVVALDNVKVAELVLTASGETSEYGFPLWTLSDIEITSVSGEYGAEIVAPADVELLVNGHVLDGDFMTDNAVLLDVAGYRELPEGHSQPLYVRYRVDGFLKAPTVEARVSDGGECVVELTKDTGTLQSYRVTHYAGDEFAAAAGIKAEFAAKLYAEFITKDASMEELLPYLLPEGNLYQHLQGFSNYWYIDHDSNEFKNLKLENFIIYDASHYSCDISFDYYIRMGSQTHEYPTAYTLYFVWEENQWKLATLEIR